jgi:hypothetical protein
VNDSERRFPAILKELLSFGALLYIAGFLALRARLNFLGVHAGLPLSDQLYLEYGGSFLLTTLASAFPIAFLAFVLIGSVFVIAAIRKHRLALPWLEKIGPRAVLAIQFVLAVALFKLTERHFYQVLFPGCAFSSFCSEGDGQLAAMIRRGGQAGAYLWQLATLGATGLVLLLFRRGSLGTAPAPAWLRLPVSGLLAFQILMLPVAYGLMVRSYSYPLALVETDNGSFQQDKPLYVLFETNENLVLFDGHTGMLNVERKQIKSYHILCSADVLRGEPCNASKEFGHVETTATSVRSPSGAGGSAGSTGAVSRARDAGTRE